MKTPFKLLIIAFLLPLLGFSNGDDLAFTKQKNIKKAYIVNSDAGINIDNSYGNIYVTTWDEDKIEIDVLIKVSGDSEAWVTKRISDIDVEIEALKSMVSARTIIGRSDFYNNGNSNSFEINYTIKIPKKGSINLNNKYGDIITGDIMNKTDIVLKYGKITLGKLNNASNDIQINYASNSTIQYIKNGNITTKYSGLVIDESISLNLLSEYTNTTINEIGSLNLNTKYGSLKIGKIKNIDAIGKYTGFKIGEITNKLIIDTKYGGINIASVKANKIDIQGGYSNINMSYNPDYAFDFDISLNFASLHGESDLEYSNKEEVRNAKQYSGFNKRKGANKINITSSYGSVNLNKN